jgi:hypothetical protein
LTSQPLLYYYSFMNLVKAWLVVNSVSLGGRVFHGIKEHAENFSATRLHLTAQKLRTADESQRDIQLFRELVRLCGGTLHRNAETIGLPDALAQVVAIHRTYANVFAKPERFYLLKSAEFRRAEDHASLFLRLEIEKRHFTAEHKLDLLTGNCDVLRAFRQVASPSQGSDEVYCFESDTPLSCGRVDPQRFEELVAPIRNGLHAALTPNGYRFYVMRHDGCRVLPQLAAMYAVFFYLGSVTRYHPYDFDKLRQKKYGWLIDEFLRTQPLQFLYLCVSRIVKKDLHLPLCAFHV